MLAQRKLDGRGLRHASLLSLTVALTTACGGGGGGGGGDASPLSVDPARVSIASFDATAVVSSQVLTVTDPNNGGADITAAAAYSSSDPAVVSVDGSGRVTGANNGSAVVFVGFGEALASVPVSVDVTPTLLSASAPTTTLIQPGQNAQLTVLGEFVGLASSLDQTASSTGASYLSSNLAVLVVDAEGRVTAVDNGSATVTVSNRGVVASVSFVVDAVTALLVAPQNPGLGFGDSQQLVVTGNDSAVTDLSSAASGTTYASSDPSVLTLSRRACPRPRCRARSPCSDRGCACCARSRSESLGAQPVEGVAALAAALKSALGGPGARR
jgi:hypothetical protein